MAYDVLIKGGRAIDPACIPPVLNEVGSDGAQRRVLVHYI